MNRVRFMTKPAKIKSQAVVLAALLFCTTSLSAQVELEDIRGSLRSRFGKGRENSEMAGLEEKKKHYLENRLDLEYSYKNIESGLTMESREPAEFTDNFTRLRKGYFQYSGENYLLRAGTLYGLSGQGLTLNLLEDRILDLDNSIRGFQGVVQRDRLRFQFVAGSSNYTDYREPLVIDHHALYAATLEYDAGGGLLLGANALHDRLENRKDHKSTHHLNLDADIRSWIWGPFLDLTGDKWEFFLEFSHKQTGHNRLPVPNNIYQVPIRLLNLDRDISGNGLYWNLAFSKQGYGFSLEYKNYQYNVQKEFKTTVSSSLDPAGILPFQNPPTAIKEHLYYLLKRFPLVSEPNNQIGFELELNASPSPFLDIQAVVSQASKADLLQPDPWGGNPGKARGGFPLIPRLGTSYNPAYDTFLEIRWRRYDKLHLFGGAGFRSLTEYTIRGNYGDRKMLWTFPLQAELRWSKSITTTLDIEAQHIREKTFPVIHLGNEYWNRYAAVSLSWAPLASITLSRESTGLKNSNDDGKSWMMVALSLRLKEKGIINISYGKEREGMICSNGLCRYVPGFKGLRTDLSLFY